MTYCTEPLLLLPPPQLPAMHLFPQPALCLSLTHSRAHTLTLRLWFQLGFFSLKTQWKLTGFNSEGFRTDPAIVTDIRRLDDNCCLIAETQVSLMADDNRQRWVMDGFDGKLQTWNKRKNVHIVTTRGEGLWTWVRSLWLHPHFILVLMFWCSLGAIKFLQASLSSTLQLPQFFQVPFLTLAPTPCFPSFSS